MKFKQYVKESVTPPSKVTLDENFLDKDYNLDGSSLVQDELDRFYAPVNKLIADGKFDEAKKELDELEADLNDLEATNSKKKFFKFPQFMIDGQRRRIETLRAKLPKNESIDDMNKRCEKCNTLLNDAGTCPKCDDGEEDYEDEIKEACSDYHVKKYGAYWFGIVGHEGLMLRDENNKLRLFKNKADAQKFIDETCNNLKEDMSVREKLKAAYPELNFDNPVTEDCVKGELSNKEKLKRAFPELNFDKEPLTEGTRAALATKVHNAKNEAFSAREKLKAAYPELDFGDNANEGSVNRNLDTSSPSVGLVESTGESLNSSLNPDEFDYDDDYEMDDVEQDRAHAALYGGDRMYCDCGKKLSYDEWGSYCPDCNPPDSDDNVDENFEYRRSSQSTCC